MSCSTLVREMAEVDRFIAVGRGALYGASPNWDEAETSFREAQSHAAAVASALKTGR